MKRTLYENIWERLSAHKQMVLLQGRDRQVKPLSHRFWLKIFNNSLYFNWDILEEKRKLIENLSSLLKPNYQMIMHQKA